MNPPVANGSTTTTNNQKITSELEGSSDQIRRLGEKIEQVRLPLELRENLVEIVKRLALIRASAGYLSISYIAEYEIAASYINRVVSLPWDITNNSTLDLSAAKTILDKNHYGLDVTKNKILEYLATIILNMKNNKIDHISHAPILCLVGLAGTGKTTLASSVAEALGRKFERIPFGGMGDARLLRGQSRVLPDSEPGLIMKKLAHAKSKNCVILLDELDRISDSARSDVMGVLVELLDPEQNKSFVDHYIDFPFDLSQVLFIVTANNTTNIATAVLDRIEMIQLPSYTDDEKIVIGKNYLFPKIRANTGLLENQLTIDETLWPTIIRPLGFDSGIRSLERTIDGICKKVAFLVVEKKVETVHVGNDNVKQFLSGW